MPVVPATQWLAGMRITAGRLLATDVQRGSVDVSFTALGTYTTVVTFPVPFATPPIMTTGIASGTGPTARFGSRAISVTNTGFTLFVFVTDLAEGTDTWAAIPVHWIAVAA